MNKEVRPFSIAQLGVGRIGTMHARLLVGHPLVETLVLADASPERAAAVADELGCRHAPIEHVLDPANPLGLDGLVIATSTSTHADLLVRAAEIGLPTYCEKPIALNLDEALRAQAALEAAGLPHHIGFHRRFDEGYSRARVLVGSGALGEVRRVHALTCDPIPPGDDFVRTSGGIFVDCNAHDFDILRWVLGREVVEVYSTGSARGKSVFAEEGDVSDAVTVVTFDDGTVGSVQASRYNGQGYEVRLDISGTEGSANVGLDNKVPFRSVEDGVDFPREEPWFDFIERFRPCYERELDHFLRHPMIGEAGACTASDAVQALRIAVACKRSLESHAPVRVADVG